MKKIHGIIAIIVIIAVIASGILVAYLNTDDSTEITFAGKASGLINPIPDRTSARERPMKESLASISCTDTDFISILEQGTVTTTNSAGITVERTDSCVDEDIVLEYSCVNGTTREETEHSCQSVSSSYPYYVCQEGACVRNKIFLAAAVGYYDADKGYPIINIIVVNNGEAITHAGEVGVQLDHNFAYFTTDMTIPIRPGDAHLVEVEYVMPYVYTSSSIEAVNYRVEPLEGMINFGSQVVDEPSDNDLTIDSFYLFTDATAYADELAKYATINNPNSDYELAIGEITGTLDTTTNTLTIQAEIINFGPHLVGYSDPITYAIQPGMYSFTESGSVSGASTATTLNQGDSLVVEEVFTSIDPVYVEQIVAQGGLVENVYVQLDEGNYFDEVFESNNVRTADIVVSII